MIFHTFLPTSTKTQFLLIYVFSMKTECSVDIMILMVNKSVHTIFI